MNPSNCTNKTQEQEDTVYVVSRPQSNSCDSSNFWDVEPGCCAVWRWRRGGYAWEPYLQWSSQLQLQGRHQRRERRGCSRLWWPAVLEKPPPCQTARLAGCEGGRTWQ